MWKDEVLYVKKGNYIIDSEGRKAYYHHTALCQGYVSVKCGVYDMMEKYKGRFGEGYTVLGHNPQSTFYCLKYYYIYED